MAAPFLDIRGITLVGAPLGSAKKTIQVPDLDAIEQSAADALTHYIPGSALGQVRHGFSELAMLSVGDPWVVFDPIDLSQAAVRKFSTGILEQAIEKNVDAHLDALVAHGFPKDATAILQSLLETMVESRVLQRQIELGRLATNIASVSASMEAMVKPADFTQMFSAMEFANALGVSGETVRRRERDGEVFSILRPGRQRGREYPAFQAWDGIVGDPLKQVLGALGPDVGSAAFGFFTSPSDLLAGLAPLEVLLGYLISARELDDVNSILAAEPSERLEAVRSVAEVFTTSG